MNIVASGNGWTLSEDDEEEYVLALKSEYGVVEVKLKGMGMRMLARDIENTFAALKAQGPIVESEVEA